jgi:hypothetical protein
MKDTMQEVVHRSPWLDWQPKSPNITITPEKEPSKPTEPSLIACRNTPHVYFETATGICFKDSHDRFWHFDRITKELCEIVPGRAEATEPISSQTWEAYGSLLGILAIYKSKKGEE